MVFWHLGSKDDNNSETSMIFKGEGLPREAFREFFEPYPGVPSTVHIHPFFVYCIQYIFIEHTYHSTYGNTTLNKKTKSPPLWNIYSSRRDR